jgi:2-aminoadipate transaminase
MTATLGLSQRARWAAGQPISHLMHRALAHPELISLAAGFVDPATLPVEISQEFAAAVLSDPVRAKKALQYGTNIGLAALREAVLKRVCTADGDLGSNVSIDQVLVTAGSNQLLHLVTDTLCDAGDIVLCAAPAYFVYLGILRNLGVRAVGIESDEDGVLLEALEEELQRRQHAGELSRVKAIYLTTYFNNPSGVTMSLERRQGVVEIARRWSLEHPLYVIEDGAYRELRYEGADVPSLWSCDASRDLVIHAQTFSKSFAPGLRTGFGILPAELMRPVCDQKGNIDFGAPNFSQYVLLEALESGRFDDHVEQLRAGYRVKRDAMLAAADESFGDLPGTSWLSSQGGLYVWMSLDESIDTGPDGRLLDLSLQEGVLYVPGEYCYPGDGTKSRRNQMRLSFGVQTPEGIRAGMGALRRAIDRL